jgi:DNA gyrase inhibitor GyrI
VPSTYQLAPETKLAAIEPVGSPALEYETVRKLIAWKLENRLRDPLKYRSMIADVYLPLK